MAEIKTTWRETLSQITRHEVITMLFFGFSAGIPLLLIFSSLSLWLREAGVERATVTYFSWAALAFSFKFLWAPLADHLPIPLLTKRLGRRRAWMLISQISIMISILCIASFDPSNSTSLTWIALSVIFLGFSAATQDIIIDAYRIESASGDLQALLSSSYIAGYRIGMLVSGAGALLLASYFGSSTEEYVYDAWRWTYQCVAATVLVGITTTLLCKEPDTSAIKIHRYRASQYARFLILFVVSVLLFVGSYQLSSSIAVEFKTWLGQVFNNTPLANFLIEFVRLPTGVTLVALFLMLISRTAFYEKELVDETYLAPIKDFFNRFGFRFALLLLLFIGFFRISDIVLGVIANVFFQDMGFSKNEIATIVKSFGLFMTILGGFMGGILSIKIGVMRTLYLGAILTVLTNLLFLLLAQAGHNVPLLTIVISADNLTAGLASAAFVAFLSSLTNVSFTAMQYAIFSSLMTLLPKVIGGYSGSMVENLGYPNFFLFASMIGLPVILLIYLIDKHVDLMPHQNQTDKS